MSSSKRWVAVVGLPIVGFFLLWWAAEQLQAARLTTGSTFQFQTWRVLGWLLTMIAVGAVFGLAAGAARSGRSRANVSATLIAAVLPFATVVYYWTHLSFGWFPTIRNKLFALWPAGIIVASCVAVGFLLSGLLAHRLAGSDRV